MMLPLNQTIMMGHAAAASFQDTMEQAAVWVDRTIQLDRNYLDLSELLQIPKHNQPTASGLYDFDYPSLADPQIGLGSLAELGMVRKVPLPAELTEQYGQMQCNCLMGIFPEISRAWLSVDSRIFIWNFEDGSDLAYFDGLTETILCVGLVKPKPGIFQPHIAYLLCLCSPVDIVLLAISFTKPNEAPIACGPAGELQMLPEPLFTIPTDNTHFISIVGDDNGRIFMAAKDGCLYELHYQAEDGWFSRKCRKINLSTGKLSFMMPSFLNFSYVADDPLVQISVDNSRHILYTRSHKGTIQVYDLGDDGQSVSRVAAISQQTTMQYASLVARTVDKSNFKTIVHIAAIPDTESTNIHLVAVTDTGVRLYFTTNPFGENRGRPSMLSMVHVRLPPGFSASATLQRPSHIHTAYYRKGTLFMSSSQAKDNDLLWTVGPDSFPFQKQLMETIQRCDLSGLTWAMSEIPTPVPDFQDEITARGPLQKSCPPLVVTQHMEPTRRLVIVNSEGTYLMNKLSPADQLKQLLLSKNGPDADEVQAFFKLHKEDQACATCLILACSRLNQAEQQVCDWATRAFFLYGGEPDTYGLGPASGIPPFAIGSPIASGPPGGMSFMTPGPGLQPHQMSTPYPSMVQQSQLRSPASSFNQTAAFTQETVFSGKHNGLYLYLGRLLRPMWEYRMVSDVPCYTPQGEIQYLASRFRSEELSWFLEQLEALKDFLERNAQFTSPLISTTSNISDAQAQESMSLQCLQQLVYRTCECLGLWKILCDHQFHIQASSLTKDQQNTLKMMSFRNFVTAGAEISGALVQCVINSYLNDYCETEAIISRIREVCPSLYSSEDALCSKANEMLHVARGMQHKDGRHHQLEEALQHYKQITAQLDLPTIRQQFANVRFYTGIVDLSLTAASKRDPQNLALHYYRNGQLKEDLHGRQMYMARMECYTCILDTLWELLFTSVSHPQAPSVPRSPGPPPTPDPNRLTNTEAEQYAEKMYNQCLDSNDEMFHVALYDWLIEKNLKEKLLEQTQSPYLEPYLKRAASLQPDHLAMLDLLWKYYEKTKSYSAAAKILAKLADRHSTEVSLGQRIEYLSRATMCAKSSTLRTSSASEGQFLHGLEEKMEVATVQLKVYEAISRKFSRTPQGQEAMSRLNSQLMDITTLYADFAELFGLSECKLAIIHSAGHYDPTLVEAIWKELIDKELQSLATAPVKQKMNTLSNRLIAIGRTYGATERYFPLPFLVKYLEKKSCELNFDRKFVYKTIMDIGITLPKLQEIYDRLFKSKDPCWQTLKRPLHLLHVIHSLLDSFAQSPSIVPAYERRSFTTVCLDSIALYLVELKATSSTDPIVRALTADFKDVQCQMERL